jgi:hypothetical protein
MIRMNIMMPEDLAKHLKTVPNKSRYIAEALEQRMVRERSQKLRALLVEAYTENSFEDLAVDRAWSGTLHDGGFSV